LIPRKQKLTKARIYQYRSDLQSQIQTAVLLKILKQAKSLAEKRLKLCKSQARRLAKKFEVRLERLNEFIIRK